MGLAEREEREVELAETFADVARALLDETGVDATLDRICSLAEKTVDGCQAAGISIAQGTRVTSRSRTNELPRSSTSSSQIPGGPVRGCHQGARGVPHGLAREQRWPEFTPQARERTGVESILSLRLFAREDTLGSLNLYSLEPNAFNDDDIAVASVFAAHAAVALAGATRGAQLEAKADTRDVIGMAKGIIMAGQGVSDDEAFSILRRASQRTNVKLREMAERIVRAPAPPEGLRDQAP